MYCLLAFIHKLIQHSAFREEEEEKEEREKAGKEKEERGE
jgi:hypothetical protein